MTATDSAVGIDPAGAEVLARELQDAERLLSEAASEIRAALADAGVASFAAVELDDISAWCRTQAMEVRRRAGAVNGRGLNARAAESVFGHDREVSDLRRARLFALLGLGSEDPEVKDWLVRVYPELVARRQQVDAAAGGLRRARARVSVDAYVGGSATQDSSDRMAQLARMERADQQKARATAAEMERFLADLDDEQVRHLAEALLDALSAGDGPDRGADMAEAMAPLRSRLRDQLAEAAAQAYIGRPGRQRVDIAALAELYKGLGFERRRSSNPLTEFAAGVFFGDFARRDGDEGASISRTLGHLASGIFAVGDVRDALAGVSKGRWGDAALAAFGAVPIAGDLAKAEDAADDALHAARVAQDTAGEARRGVDDVAASFKGTPLESWTVGEPMPNASAAIVDYRKLHDYSMKEGNPRNHGKFKAFGNIGYEVSTDEGRFAATADVVVQLRAHLGQLPPARDLSSSTHGPRLTIDVPLRGPNGKTGTLVTRWQFDHGSDVPKLITNYLKEHR